MFLIIQKVMTITVRIPRATGPYSCVSHFFDFNDLVFMITRQSNQYGKAHISRALYLKAWTMSPWSKECSMRWAPHPGHRYPVIDKNIHFG